MARKKKLENPIKEYYQAIKSGKIVACKEIKLIYQHLYKKLTDTSIDGFHYDEKKAARAIRFIEIFCHLPKVRGNPLVKLMLWQKALIAAIFGFVDDKGIRQYTEVCLLVGRKNAKSTLAGMIGLYLQIADQEAQPELYTVATKRDQAKILWQSAVDMVHKSPDLRKYAKTKQAEIVTAFNGGVFKPLASDSNSLDGLNANAVFLDEIHAYKDCQLYDVMVDSMAMRHQPLTILTTTAGFQREGLFDAKISEYQMIIRDLDNPQGYKDPRRLPILYKLDSEKEWLDSSCWVKANPGLGEIRSLSKLAEDVERAKTNPEKRKDLLTKFFDLPQTGINHFLSIEEATNEQTFDIQALKPTYFIGGFDLSQVNDLTSAVALFKVPNDSHFYCLSMSWIPEESLEKHLKTDKVPYDIWREKGWLRTCPGNQIDYHSVASWFQELMHDYNLYPYKIGYDRYSSNYLVKELENLLGQNTLVPIAQGARTLSIPLQNLRAELGNKNIIYDNNQLMRWCLLNLQVVQDTNANLNTVKNRNATVRDDAAMALLDALAVLNQDNNLQNYLNLILQ